MIRILSILLLLGIVTLVSSVYVKPRYKVGDCINIRDIPNGYSEPTNYYLKIEKVVGTRYVYRWWLNNKWTTYTSAEHVIHKAHVIEKISVKAACPDEAI